MRPLFIALGISAVCSLAIVGLGYQYLSHSPEVALETVSRFLPTVKNAPSAAFLRATSMPLVAATVEVAPSLAREAAVVKGKKLSIPEGWRISVFAAGFTTPRMLARDESGNVFVTARGEGKVYALRDTDGDGVADQRMAIASGLKQPSGILWHEGVLYVAEEDKVSRFQVAGDGAAVASGAIGSLPAGGFNAAEKQTLVGSLRPGGNHTTRTLAILGKTLYVSVGSSCNACVDDPHRGVVLAFDLDGKNERIFASGLRNSVGMIAGPDGKLWATDNGRDLLGDDIPPEEVNTLDEGADYGWPFCYGDRVPDPEFGSVARCEKTRSPVIAFSPHSAPLGLRFLDETFGDLAGSLLVAQHGSWNRMVPIGYAVVRFSKSGDTWQESPFVTGWRPGAAPPWGRPVDMIDYAPGKLLVTDDKAGVIYLLQKNP